MSADRAELLDRYRRAVDYIDREIVRLTPRRRDRDGKVEAALSFNRSLGDPQRDFPSVQVAGTSGKGSVSHMIAATLEAAGINAGLHVSPYLQAFTEKTWIRGRYCSPVELERALDATRPTTERFGRDQDCPASVHGLTSLAVSYVAFRNAEIDLAVMETGLGGRFDLVQGLHRELTVITELGLDHLSSLGPSLEEIAWHKAGIMEEGVTCVAAKGLGWPILEAEAKRVGAHLIPVEVEVAAGAERSLRLELETLGECSLDLPAAAGFARRNATIAGHAIDRLVALGYPITTEHLARGAQARFPGRFEVIRQHQSPTIILDCAHNEQKVEGLVGALEALDPDAELTLVFAASGSRSPEDLLRPLVGRATRLIATELDLYGKPVVDAVTTAEAGARLGIPSRALAEPREALEHALDASGRNGTVVVTGSVYLVGLLRDSWYPTEEVILQGTSWPTPTDVAPFANGPSPADLV